MSHGERQEGRTLDEIRVDHVNRYTWAGKQLKLHGRWGDARPSILDAFCGVGYGSNFLAWQLGDHLGNPEVLGIDRSQEALALAREHWSATGVTFDHFDWPSDTLPLRTFDAVVCLESLEHVENPLKLFTHLAQSLVVGGVLVFSTPNEDELPKLPGTFPHHHEHWPLIKSIGAAGATIEDAHRHENVQLELISWAGQDVYRIHPGGAVKELLATQQMNVLDESVGQFTLVAARRIS